MFYLVQLVERQLQPWQPSADAGGGRTPNRGLDDEISRTGGAGSWDQFAAQPELKTTYR